MTTLPNSPLSSPPTPALRSCPFCGGPAQATEPVRGHYIVQCDPDNDCAPYVTVGPCNTAEEAARAWNKRA